MSNTFSSSAWPEFSAPHSSSSTRTMLQWQNEIQEPTCSWDDETQESLSRTISNESKASSSIEGDPYATDGSFEVSNLIGLQDSTNGNEPHEVMLPVIVSPDYMQEVCGDPYPSEERDAAATLQMLLYADTEKDGQLKIKC